ncbi:MAG: peptidoglycan DD-metalloendopeptidase family protein [Proteobacteria bacterium]|nr:peptidoglycan DD-metalloendopeptidase family protein [Pseudomonadota bacterium]MBI3497483.1 peptidoglycan DD-metalloendopeptidase family protein [Pseudomonadota bacterium]
MFDRPEPLAKRLLALPNRWFVEREIILRSEGRTRYVRLSRHLQMAVAGFWVVMAAWVSFTSTSYFEFSRIVENKSEALDQARDDYRNLLNQMGDYQVSVMGIMRELETKQAHLRGLLNQNEALKQDLKSTESQLKLSEAERSNLAQHRMAIGDKLNELEGTLRSMLGENGALERHIATMRSQLASIEAEKQEIAAQRSALSNRMNQMQTDLRLVLSRNAQLESSIDGIRQELASTAVQRDQATDEGTGLKRKVGDLEARIADLQGVHREVLARLNERTRADLNEVQKIISRTGLNLDTMLPKVPVAPTRRGTSVSGQGGPFVPLPKDLADGGNIEAMTAALNLHLQHLDGIQSALRAIPLTPPIDAFTLMSGFGPRMDPFNGQAGMHYGLDLSAPLKTPVMATAPGVVVVAGWRSRYGRLVEIDHGHGLRTRYAHLHKFNVRRGQRVQFREVIGLLGSTGRSTGPHVHYEVLVNGEARDPARFLKAGKDVFKG